MEINKLNKLPQEYNKVLNCFLFIKEKVITKDNLFEIVDYHFFNKGISIFYQDVRNKNNYNIISFTQKNMKKLKPREILEMFERGVFYNSEL